jgi:fucose permease
MLSTTEQKHEPVAGTPAAVFQRDRLTWLGYLLYGFWSLAWGLFAPVMPFLREELNLTFSIASLHFSALAAGLLLAGITGSGILSRFPRMQVLWAGMAGVASAVLALSLSSHECISIAAGAVIGFAGSLSGQAIIGGLVDRFPARRDTTVPELVIVSSVFAAVAPLMVASASALGGSWRTACMLPLGILACILIGTKLGGGKELPQQKKTVVKAARLPLTYWLYFGIIFLTVAAEWSVAFWCPMYLERAHHFNRADACNALSAFLFAMLGGRIFGARLAHRFGSGTVLIAATALAAIGFLAFWTSSHPLLIVGGLVVLGLGESNCYPLAFASALGTAPGKTTEATAKMSISTGAAILLAPLLLGLAADRLGIAAAYGFVAILFGLALSAAVGIACLHRNVTRMHSSP